MPLIPKLNPKPLGKVTLYEDPKAGITIGYSCPPGKLDREDRVLFISDGAICVRLPYRYAPEVIVAMTRAMEK